MKKNYIKKLVGLGLSLCMIGAVGGCSPKADTEVAKQDDKFTIVTSFYPVYISTLNIVKDIESVEVVNMTEPVTGCLHDYSLTTKDMKNLEKADAFVINGAGMEAFLDKIKGQMPKLNIIEASEGIELIAEGDEEAHEHKDEADEHKETTHTEGEEEDHDHGVYNPHVFVSISKVIEQVNNIEKELSALDKEHSGTYKKNAEAYVAKLEAQKEKMHRELKDIKHKDIITFHEAFPYFAEEFDLNIVGVIAREPGSEPSAKELVEVIEQVKALGIKALFAEPQYSPKSAQTIAKETGATIYTLDPCVTGPIEENAYIEAMEKNLETLKEALK